MIETAEESLILDEFRSLWPLALKKQYGGETVTIHVNAVKVGENQYQCFYETKSNKMENIRDLDTLKRDIKTMKSYLNIK